jgi:two-component system, OmpR family, phosphate regulon sensor histidine kinase PhoR
MKLRHIRWRIAVPYVLLIVAMMVGLAVYLSAFVRRVYLAEMRAHLLDESRLLAANLEPSFGLQESYGAWGQLATQAAGLVRARITVIAADGTVLADSEEDRSRLDNHLYRPEVQQAISVGEGSAIRYSDTLRYDMLYAATRVLAQDGSLYGVVRVALPMSALDSSVRRVRGSILLATLVAALLALLLSVGIAQRSVRQVRWLTEVVQRMAGGDLDARLVPTTQDEVGALTRAFDDMADRLRDTINTLGEERSRLSTVLEHMADGAVIVDASGRVRLLNPAAARQLGTSAEWALGRSLAEVARHHQIIAAWQTCHDRAEEQVEPIEVARQGPFLQVVASPLHGAGPGACLLLLQDLTRMRRLEMVRRDFVSNISHELRTPLASLKALTETLRDGALEDAPAAQHFLERMEIEVDALTQMVEELLELSRIESGRVPFRLTAVDLSATLLPALERLRPQAERANVHLATDLPEGLPPVLADAERVQQVATNLLHNAIKFTPAAGNVTLTASVEGQDVVVTVQDTGIGIPADILPRIFERFFKADRSRTGGGTGLGLAIAKHIVEAHHGRIWVESTEGKGSTFRVSLPIANRG